MPELKHHIYRFEAVRPELITDADAWVRAELTDGTPDGFNQVVDYSTGGYTLTVPGGLYRVGAGASGYVTQVYSGVLHPDVATPVLVTVSQTTRDIDFALDWGGFITGTVRDESAQPIAGLMVKASVYTMQATRSLPVQWATTDANGVYTIDGLISGDMAFSPDGNVLAGINAQGKAHIWWAPSFDEIAAAEAQLDVPQTPAGVP